MNNMRLIPALRYQLQYMTLVFLGALGVLAAIFIVLTLLGVFTSSDETVNINIMDIINIGSASYDVNFNVGAIMMFMLFIIAIGSIREDLRFLLQHGMGRCTTYFSTLLGHLISGAALGLLCELFNLAAGYSPVFVASGLTFPGGFFSGWMLHMGCFFLAGQLGVLISLIYYLLNKIQTIVFSVTGGAILLFGLPSMMLNIFGEDASALETILAVFANPFALACLIFLIGALTAAANFLLLRRAQVR